MSQNPAYNLKAVLKETGLKADLLRAWERRYGLPMPERSLGGHRLYSQRDIETIKWLMARQNEGLSISRAVDLWREIQSNARDPLVEASQPVSTEITPSSVPAEALETLRTQWLSGCLAFSEALADQALNQAFALYPLETVCMDLIQRGLAEIGSLWYENRASVQQEHFASALAMRRLDALLAACAPPTRSQTILVGCPAEEAHTLTALLIALFLRRRGLNVIYLGANVPDTRFSETITVVKADLVVLIAQQLITAATLQRIAISLAADGIQVAFGGRIFSLQPDLASHVPGHFLGNSLEGVVERVESLLAGGTQSAQSAAPGNQYIETLAAFRQKRSSVEAELDESSKSLRAPLEYIYTANQFLGENIIAALSLGDMAFLDAEINWLKTFLQGHRMPVTLVYEYLRIYAEAARHQLPAHSGPVVAWLESQIQASH